MQFKTQVHRVGLANDDGICKKGNDLIKEKYNIRDYLYWCRNFITMLWWKWLLFLGVKRSDSPIPKGVYCFTPNDEKNAQETQYGYYHINLCKYYKTLGATLNGCSYLGSITKDIQFNDQCKICGKLEVE